MPSGSPLDPPLLRLNLRIASPVMEVTVLPVACATSNFLNRPDEVRLRPGGFCGGGQTLHFRASDRHPSALIAAFHSSPVVST